MQDYSDPQNWLSVFGSAIPAPSPSRLATAIRDSTSWSAQADQETDQDARMPLYDEAQRLLIADAPIAIGLQDTNALIVKPYVTGYTVSPQDFWPGYSSPLTVDVEPTAVAPVATPTP